MRNFIAILFLNMTFTFHFGFAQEHDPNLWLEEIESPESLEWVRKQNKETEERLSQELGFESLKNRFLEVYDNDEKIDYPNVTGKYVYNLWKDEKNKRGLWRRMLKDNYNNGSAHWEVVLDLDKLSEEEGKKWVFKGAEWLRPGYEICLLKLSDGGTDKVEVREFDAKKKEFVKNGFQLPESKGSVSWINKNEILLCIDFGDGTTSSSGYPLIAKRWKRGSALEEAKTLYKAKDDYMGVWTSSEYVEDYFIFLTVSHSFYERAYYVLLEEELIPLQIPKDARVHEIDKQFMYLTLDSDWSIDKEVFTQGSLVSVNIQEILEQKLNVKTVFKPGKRSSINQVGVTKNGLIVNVLNNISSELYQANYQKGAWSLVRLEAPQMGTLSLVDYHIEQEGFYYRYSGFLNPTVLYYKEGEDQKIVRALSPQFFAKDLEVHQLEANSKDGTTIPYFIIHHKDIEYNSKNPTLVYAYGGFNISLRPYYNVNAGVGWLEQGGVYVVANIRGGGEFGPSWHKAAMKEKRQNAYDDLYAVCEDIINKKITSRKNLGLFGWSNGGLMAGVAATQRPDLFHAVIIGAPLLDMQRYHKMLAGSSWIAEYGNPEIPEEWNYIKKYSPYHNIKKNKIYPEVLLVTSTKDDRVHPAHARKMAARLGAFGHPYYYYETIEGGHGAASTNEQEAFLHAIMFTYLKVKLME